MEIDLSLYSNSTLPRQLDLGFVSSVPMAIVLDLDELCFTLPNKLIDGTHAQSQYKYSVQITSHLCIKIRAILQPIIPNTGSNK